MSVVVRMEMPTSCEKCPACDYEEGNCLLADDRNTLPHNGKRRSWCPILCQLPEWHGRLVDADANFIGVIHLGEGGFANYTTTIAKRLGEEDMRVVKTIVPAEPPQED